MTGAATSSSAASSATGAGPHPRGRTVVIWLAVLVSLQARPLGPPLLMPVLLLLGVGVSVALLRDPTQGPRSWSRWASPQPPAVTLVALGLLLAGFEEGHFAAPGRSWLQLVVVVSLTTLGLCACGLVGPPRLADAAFVGFLVVSTAAQLALLAHAPSPGDASIVEHDSVAALLHGHNPYAITFPNPYEHARTLLFFQPEDLVGNRLAFGYAYLPVSLLGGIPGYLLGNVGYAYVAALVALTVLLRSMATDATGRVLCLAPLAMSFTPQLLLNQWVEPIAMLCLGVCAWGWQRSRVRVASSGLGLLLASKQYVVLLVPLLWLVRRALGTRALAGAVALAVVLVGSFVLLDPQAFWHSTVWLQFHLPLREDSVSVPAGWSRTFGSPPPGWLGDVGLLAGITVSALVARRGSATASTFAVGTGLSLLATVALSEHAFSNYYALIEVALVVGCVTWPSDDLEPAGQRGTVSSQTVP